MQEKFERREEKDESEEHVPSLGEICAEFLTSDDAEFLDKIAADEQVVYIYDRLNEEGYNPDEILQAYGVTGGNENE